MLLEESIELELVYYSLHQEPMPSGGCSIKEPTSALTAKLIPLPKLTARTGRTFLGSGYKARCKPQPGDFHASIYKEAGIRN